MTIFAESSTSTTAALARTVHKPRPEIFPEWPLAAIDQPPPAKVLWVREQPFNVVGSWEPLSFRRRAGYAWTDDDQFAADNEFSDAALDQYRRLGATCLVLPYNKGFGLQSVAREIDEQKEILQRAQAKGLKVALYVRVDSVAPESLASEYPNITQWLAQGAQGHTGVYTHTQGFRRVICHNHPEAMAYLESVFRHAICDMGADMLHLDGFAVCGRYPGEKCRCPRCVASYRLWLEQHLPDPQQREALFGCVDFERIEPPYIEPNGHWPAVVNAPDIQCWIHHQWDKQLAFARHIRRFVHRLNPNTAININPTWTYQLNHFTQFHQWNERLLDWFDAIWIEDEMHLRYQDGRIITRQDLLKQANQSSCVALFYHPFVQTDNIESSLSLATAANGGHQSCLGFSFRYLPHCTLGETAKTRIHQWANQHWPLLGNTQPAGDLFLVRHQRSLAWNAIAPWHSSHGLQQLLTQMQVPWQISTQLDPRTLAQANTILLPDAECLSDDELQRLKRWVEHGGRLLITLRSGTCNEYRQRRPRPAFVQWSAPWRDHFEQTSENLWWMQWIRQDIFEFTLDVPPKIPFEPDIQPLGQGHVGLWPDIEMACTVDTAQARIRPTDLNTPKNASALQAFIKQLHGPSTLTCHAPPSVLLEYTYQPTCHSHLLHLIQTDTQAANINVQFTTPQNQHYVLHSPDATPPQMTVANNNIVIENLQRYAVIEIRPT